jgi:hypothetical protein
LLPSAGEPEIILDLVNALAESLLAGLIDPLVIVPAIAVGALARRWWQALLGAAAVAAAVFAVGFFRDLPEDAEMAWAAVPVAALAPVAWSSAAFLGVRRWRNRAQRSWRSILLSVVGAAAGLLSGGLIGGVAGGLLGAWYVEAAHVSNSEGASGYVVVFLFLFPGVTIGAAIGAVLGWLLGRRAGAARVAAEQRVP